MRPFQYNEMSDNLLHFFLRLREHGFLFGSREIADAFSALKTIDMLSETTFKETLKIIFCTSKVERECFEYLFRQYIYDPAADYDARFTTKLLRKKQEEDSFTTYELVAERENLSEQRQEGHTHDSHDQVEFIALFNEKDVAEEAEETALQRAINILHKHPRVRKITVPHYQFSVMQHAARLFLAKINTVHSRRKKVITSGNTFDIRKTLRKSLTTGGIPIEPVRIGKRQQRKKLLFFIDASRSMANFAKNYLQFAYALAYYTSDIEIFLFSTEIKKVTQYLRFYHERRFPVLTLNENVWEGGTCIGESLARFLYDEGSRLLTKNTLCIIASDGLDAGDLTYLQTAMQTIHERSRYVLWLNPLMNLTGYEPAARGMKTALPYIDLLAEAVDAQGMLQLAKKIQIKR